MVDFYVDKLLGLVTNKLIISNANLLLGTLIDREKQTKEIAV